MKRRWDASGTRGVGEGRGVEVGVGVWRGGEEEDVEYKGDDRCGGGEKLSLCNKRKSYHNIL